MYEPVEVEKELWNLLYAAYAVQLSQSRFNSEKISQTAVKGHVEVDKLAV